jgi:hypothetical protein
VASSRLIAGCRQQSPRSTPPRFSRSRQTGPRASSRTSRMTGAGSRSVLVGAVDHGVEQAAGAGLVLEGEQVGLGEAGLTQTAQQGGAALEPDQRVLVRDLEALGQIAGGQEGQGHGVDAPGIVLGDGEGPGLEHPQGGDGQPLGAGQGAAGAGVLVRPVRARAGVQQHGDDGEVELGPGARGGVEPVAGLGNRAPQVDAVDGEMPPAGVEGHGQGRILVADHGGDVAGRLRQPVEVDRPVVEAAGDADGQHLMGAFADGGGVQQAVGLLRFRTAQGRGPPHGSGLRPTAGRRG